MNGGYVLIDLEGINIAEDVSGTFNTRVIDKLHYAFKNHKPVCITNYSFDSFDTGATFVPYYYTGNSFQLGRFTDVDYQIMLEIYDSNEYECVTP